MGSIRVTDTRTWRSAGYDEADEHQFLVGDDRTNEDEAGEGRSKSLSLDGDEEDRLGRRLDVMGNAGAQLSRLDIHTSNGHLNGEDGSPDNESRGLSAKAGIILVRYFQLHLNFRLGHSPQHT